jgi:predicted Rossmann fold flavoprotein
VLEKHGRVLKKLLATGNGRCNFTNTGITGAAAAGRYHTRAPEAVRAVLDGFNAQAAVDFFETLGIVPLAEDGRVYPLSGQAAAVSDCLRLLAERLGVVFRTDFPVAGVAKKNNRFLITGRTANETVAADSVVIATGGLASPQLGADGSGFRLLTAFGHHIIEPKPALVQLKSKDAFIKPLQGVKSAVRLTASCDGKRIPGVSEGGELLFTSYGVSGNAVFQISFISALYPRFTLMADFLPSFTEAELWNMLLARRENLKDVTCEYFLSGLLQKKIGQCVVKRAGSALSYKAGGLRDGELSAIAALCKAFPIEITGTTGFTNAQATAGGADLSEFTETMESRLCPRLFAVGEVLDVCGECGGFNLHWAWASGAAAGRGVITP